MEKNELWQQLDKLEIGDQQANLTFARRLARENGWSESFATRCIAEYKRFIYLATTSKTPCTPSDAVDQVWHLHLTYTQSYWQDMCQDILQTPLHHNPTLGGHAQQELFFDQYEQTLARYQQTFGERPPTDIWPDSEQRFAGVEKFIRINSGHYWMLPKPGQRTIALTALAGISVTLAACTSNGRPDPLIALLLIAIIAFPILLLYIYSRRRKRKSKDGNGCGSGMGGCGGKGDGGCGGGGCGGCGG